MAVSHHNTRHTKTCDPAATCTKTYSLYKTYTTYGYSIMVPGSSTTHHRAKKFLPFCPENVLPLAARPHSAMVVHQLHCTLPGLPSVCQMGHSVWAFWPNRCEFYRPKSVLKSAGGLYACVLFYFLPPMCTFMFVFFFFCGILIKTSNTKFIFCTHTQWVTITASKQKQIKAKKRSHV